MNSENLDDWRIEAIARLESELPASYPGGPSFEKGSKVYMSFNILTSRGEHVGFPAPNAAAMSLNLAIKASQASYEIRKTLIFKDAPSPDGMAKVVPLEQSSAAFEMFEQSLAAITFSFLALEAYCNYIISRHWKQPVEIKGKDGKKQLLSHAEAERALSTEAKIKSILPKIFEMGTPAGKAIWQRFLKLKKARDDSIHFKYADQYPLDAEKEGLFFQIWDNDPRIFPEIAIEIIEYFYTKQARPDWLARMPTVRT